MQHVISAKSGLLGECHMRKLLILPGACDALGGTLITLSLLIKGFEHCGASETLRVLVQSGSLMEKYLSKAGQGNYLQIVQAQTNAQFLRHALRWVGKQPQDWPLLLDNCIERPLIPIIALAAPKIRLSGRTVYHFCHDLALSHNYLGYLTRKLAFTCLSPRAICNSQFTARHIRRLMPDVRGILYQPVDTERFNDLPLSHPPIALQPILHSGARVILTASRINQAGIINDKNLRALIPVLAHLKATGHLYHGVVIGEDKSPGQIHTRALLEGAERSGVADRFTVLPPTFAMENYYKYADVVVTLAPREPFGRTVVEAIACGVPVVGSRTGGVGEILDNFASEWTTDPNDPVATAELIIRIATNTDTPKVLAKARQWVETHCSIEGYSRRIMQLTELVATSHTRLTVTC